MKKILNAIVAVLLCSCGNMDIPASKVDVLTECWVACELSFEASEEHGDYGTVVMDAVFVNRRSGTKLTIPSFWDGGNVFRVRFAPTETGIWDYTTVCNEDKGLDGRKGTVGSNPYKGELEIYRHGFVKAEPGRKYMTYADGTPFFYLGDTHWNYLCEEFDQAGEFAGAVETDSHFRYIVDKRVSQGFTIYQTEPIGNTCGLQEGRITEAGLEGFKQADRYYQYLAEKGLVHANAEFFFTSEMTEKLARDQAALENISRYWVARFGAYPVMWTLAQESDNDFYSQIKFFDFKSNPWVKVAEYLHKYDAYSHPLSAHQEGYTTTTVTGESCGDTVNCVSAFQYEETVKGNTSTGHNWWAVQWAPKLSEQINEAIFKEYWNSPKPAVLYEGKYCYLWTKDFGARVQGWASFLNGMCGYGYGAIEIWLYKSTYDIGGDSSDGIDTITKEEKRTPWSVSVEFPSGYQVGFMKRFLQNIEWWKLVPDFNGRKRFVPQDGAIYACASDGDGIYVVYLYNRSEASGNLTGLDASSAYECRWFNPRTGEYLDPFGFNGLHEFRIEKPDSEDWVLLARKTEQ